MNGTDIRDLSRRNLGHALPGILSWSAIGLTVLGALFFPRILLLIATVFVTYYVVRAVGTAGFALMGQHRINRWKRTDWTEGEDECGPFGFAPSDVRHVVVIPTYKEPAEILRRTIDALAAQHRASERVVLVLGMEEREPDARAKAQELLGEYAGRFLHAMYTVHPANIRGEEPGKSSNEAWAGKQAWAELERIGVDPEVTTITSCDADSCLDPAYFSAVARLFAHDERRHHMFWQAPIFFYNNMWDVPGAVRLSTWAQHVTQMGELTNPWYEPLPISTYTLSITLCERCGWWDPGVIPEDWHAYLNCLFEAGEEIGLTPIYLPTFGDATDGDSYLDAVSNRFQQLKRHSWGAEDVGYIWSQLSQRKHAWRSSTVFRFWQVWHDHAIRVLGWVFLTSAWVLSSYFSGLHWYDLGWHASIGQNIVLLRVLSSAGGTALMSMMVLELWRCPPPDGASKLRAALEIMCLGLLMPFIGLGLGMLPALVAHTRLMLGLPFAYRVTPKRIAGAATQEA